MHQVRHPAFGLRGLLATLAIAAAALFAAPASAQPSYCNGGFETFTAGSGNNRIAPGTGATTCANNGFGWSVVTNGFNSQLGWGDSTAVITPALSPAYNYNGSNYTLKPITTSNNGGNFLAVENPSGTATISQSIGGLIVNQTYTVAFEQAAAVWTGANATTTDFWNVTFGGTTKVSPTVSLPTSQNFSGWTSVQLQFLATASSMVLAFTATQSPLGQPPFALLDGVSITQQVPEPVSSALFLSSLAGLAGLRRLTRKRA